MSQKIYNGFPQFFSYTYLTGKYYGTLATQAVEAQTVIDLQSDLVGDSITIEPYEVGLLTVIRDGATLLDDQGYEIIGPNTIQVWPGLLADEVIQFKKLVGASGVIETIPTVPPVPSAAGYPHNITEATVYTDGFKSPVNAFTPTVVSSKTRVTTHFPLDEGRIDIYINNSRVSINDEVWSMIDNTTIELNDDYSATRMKVDIIKQKVG